MTTNMEPGSQEFDDWLQKKISTEFNDYMRATDAALIDALITGCDVHMYDLHWVEYPDGSNRGFVGIALVPGTGPQIEVIFHKEK